MVNVITLPFTLVATGTAAATSVTCGQMGGNLFTYQHGPHTYFFLCVSRTYKCSCMQKVSSHRVTSLFEWSSHVHFHVSWEWFFSFCSPFNKRIVSPFLVHSFPHDTVWGWKWSTCKWFLLASRCVSDDEMHNYTLHLLLLLPSSSSSSPNDTWLSYLVIFFLLSASLSLTRTCWACTVCNCCLFSLVATEWMIHSHGVTLFAHNQVKMMRLKGALIAMNI